MTTDKEEKRAKGRVALWLEPEDIAWLSRHCACPPDADQKQTDRCARIRFRANAALHKTGLKPEQSR